MPTISIECKRIDGTADLNKKYVKEGVARFVTQKYSSYYGRNVMLGFVVKRWIYLLMHSWSMSRFMYKLK